jgi:heme exporter protein C
MTAASSVSSSTTGTATARADWLLLAALAACAGAVVRALAFTPVDAMQGNAQKIIYIHVPAAIVGLYFACGLVAISSVIYLWLKDDRLDRVAESAAEVALVFLSIVLVTGPFWGKPIWGTWWTWDPRLTSTLFLWFVLVAYLVLRGAVEEAAMRARLSAVMGVLAALLVPFIHLTVYLFRTLHPKPGILTPDALTKSPMSGEMLSTFLVSLAAFSLLFVALMRTRYRWAALRDANAAAVAA